MRYRDLYFNNFLDKFGEYKDAVGDIELGDESKIDVMKIAEVCNIKVVFDSNGDCIPSLKDRAVYIDENDDECRQRFDIAVGIGYIVMDYDHPYSDNFDYVIRRTNDLDCIGFACDLLTPEWLVGTATEGVVKTLGYDKDKEFKNNEVEHIAGLACEVLAVPYGVFKDKMYEMELFVESEDMENYFK